MDGEFLLTIIKMSTEKIISAQNLSKYFGNTAVAVADASFTVEPGKIFGFLDSNGAGKTTAICMILDLLRPDAGSVQIFRKNLQNNSIAIRPQCGYLPVEFTVFKNIKATEFLKIAVQLRKTDTADFQALVQRFDLVAQKLDRQIKYLSHGMIHKIGIIQAFFYNPDLLILDEPTTGLDPLLLDRFYELLFKQRKKGETIFITSHNLTEIEKLCSKLAIIRKGKIICVKSMDELKANLGLIIHLSPGQLVDDLNIPGARTIANNGREVILLLEGELKVALKGLTELPLSGINISRPGLDEVFRNVHKEDTK